MTTLEVVRRSYEEGLITHDDFLAIINALDIHPAEAEDSEVAP